MVVVVKAMKNPRSALCKTSIMASSDIFNAFGDKLLDSNSDAFDNLVCVYLSVFFLQSPILLPYSFLMIVISDWFNLLLLTATPATDESFSRQEICL